MTYTQLAAYIGLAGYVCMASDILRGHSKQNIASWFIWAFLDSVSAVTAFYAGNKDPWIQVAFAAGSILILFLTYRQGEWKIKWPEIVAFVGAGTALLLWPLLGPVYGLSCAVAAMMIGGFAQLKDMWEDPGTQHVGNWVILLVSLIVTTKATAKYDVAHMIYPIAGIVYNTIAITFILFRPRKPVAA